MKTLGALFVGGALALAGCSGSDGAAGAPGSNGTNGNNGTNGANGATGQKLKLVIDGVTTANNVATLTFTVYPAANVCPGGTCDDKLKILGQKTFYAQEYNPTTKTFDTAKNISFPTSTSATANPPSTVHFQRITADGNGAQYTVTAANPKFTVETSTGAFVYGYIATPGAVPAPTTGHYSLPSTVASAAKVYGTVGYSSAANVAGCEKCHGKPYSKHGYRQAAVAGLPDFASCKVCHTDQRVGSDGQWFMIQDDPAALAAIRAGADPESWDTTKYAYTANIMNDTHNSHAFEFNYPQSMSNCVTCHAGKLDRILDDSCFRPSVCKSCHPVTGVQAPRTPEAGRAPALSKIIPHAVGNLYTAAENACTGCHVTGNTLSPPAPTLAQIHKGFSGQIYKDDGASRWSASIVTTVSSAAYDWASNVVTVTFTMSGFDAAVASSVMVKPTIVGSLYGYDSKDFIISGHSSQFTPATTNLEYTEGATIRGVTPATSSNSNRLIVAPATMTQGNMQWVAQFDLSTWSNLIASGMVKRIEVAFLPFVGVNPKVAPNNNTNPGMAVAGVTQTIDVSATANPADPRIAPTDSKGTPVWYKRIVDPKKCNACHDALAVTFHSPNYGSAGVVACRMCHFVGSGGSHLEMQSRSIDSYIHALHSMQYMDINTIDPQDAVSNLWYGDHVEGNYPNFAGPLNCESCHYAGTYDPPDQTKSLPGILSKSASFMNNRPRTIATYASEITGPAARACGGCHRAQMINEADGSRLAAFMAHTNDFSSNVDPSLSFTTTVAYIEYMTGGSATSIAAPTGAQVEQCMICHPTAGSDHQNLFNIWKNGIQQ